MIPDKYFSEYIEFESNWIKIVYKGASIDLTKVRPFQRAPDPLDSD